MHATSWAEVYYNNQNKIIFISSTDMRVEYYVR